MSATTPMRNDPPMSDDRLEAIRESYAGFPADPNSTAGVIRELLAEIDRLRADAARNTEDAERWRALMWKLEAVAAEERGNGGGIS